jgi:hypothetical protein
MLEEDFAGFQGAFANKPFRAGEGIRTLDVQLGKRHNGLPLLLTG